MKKYFLTGLVILLPLGITLIIILFLLHFFTKPFMGLMTQLLSHTGIKDIGFLIFTPEDVIRHLSQFLILIALFLLTLGLGFLGRWFFVHSLVKLGDWIMHKIPIINKVYKTVQDIIKTLLVTDRTTFKKVVLVPFVQESTFVIGLVSRPSPAACEEIAKSDLVSIFVPTTPNPTTGFLLMRDPKDLIYLDMKPEDAIKYIVSCGVIQPPTKKHTKLVQS